MIYKGTTGKSQRLRNSRPCKPAIMTSEGRYILKRRLIAFVNSLLFYSCALFPIHNNRIAVCTFEGRGGFGCNPKYIVNELHRRDENLEIVWLVDDLKKEFPDYIRKVHNTPLSRAYWMTTSKIWIDNYRTKYGTVKRKGQYYLNTNHYTTGIKTVGLWRGKGFSPMACLVSSADSAMIDGLIIDSDFGREMCPKGLLYKGKLLKMGAPRTDILYGDKSLPRMNFRKRHGLASDAKVVMFAPTFREKATDGKRSIWNGQLTIDLERLLKTLEARFGGDWYLCIRTHPQLAGSFGRYKHNNIIPHARVIDESNADDMYQILAAMDAYITDYSSACFEAGLAEIPVFLYADDIDEYRKDRGGFFWNITSDMLEDISLDPEIFLNTKAKLPFSISVNNKMLEKNIRSFDEREYKNRIDEMKESLHMLFDGKASDRAAEWMLQWLSVEQ